MIQVSVVAARGPHLTSQILGQIIRSLQEWVAQFLSGNESGAVEPKDVFISARHRDPLLDVGGEEHSLHVTVFANDFRSRLENLTQITDDLSRLLEEQADARYTGVVVIRLGRMATAQFPGPTT